MNLSQLDAILAAKRARERRATARAAQAAQRAGEAAAQHDTALQTAHKHESARPAQQAQIYARLCANAVPSQRLKDDAALLSGLVAYGAVLRAQAHDLAGQADACRAAATTAQQVARAAMRESALASALVDAAAQAALTAQDRAAELEAEDNPLPDPQALQP